MKTEDIKKIGQAWRQVMENQKLELVEKTYGTALHPETHDYEHKDVEAHTTARFDHVEKSHDHAVKKGYKINYVHDHDGSTMHGGMDGKTKPHKKPDVTVHHDEYDGVHTRITVHPHGKAHNDPVINKPEHRLAHDRKMDKHRHDD